MPSAPACAARMARAHRIGMIAAARVPDGRDMVDVDAEAKAAAHAFRLAAARLLAGNRRQLWRQVVGGIGRARRSGPARPTARRGRRGRPSGRQAGRADDLAGPAAWIAAMHSRDDRPVVTMSSTMTIRAPAGIAKPRRSSNSPPRRSTNIAGSRARGPFRSRDDRRPSPARRPGRPRRRRRGSSPPAPRHRRSARSGSWNTRIFCRKTGECRPDDRMKCPSSKRVGGAEFVENFVVGHRHSLPSERPRNERRADQLFEPMTEERLRHAKSRAYKAANSGPPSRWSSPQPKFTGVKMKLIGWAIRPGRRRPHTCSGCKPRRRAQPANAARPAAATAPVERAQGQSAATRPTRRAAVHARHRDRRDGSDRDGLHAARFPRSTSASRSRPARASRSR